MQTSNWFAFSRFLCGNSNDLVALLNNDIKINKKRLWQMEEYGKIAHRMKLKRSSYYEKSMWCVASNQ